MAKGKLIWKEGQSIFDVAFIAYGDASMAFQILKENQSLAEIGNKQYVGKTIEFTIPVDNDNLRKLGLYASRPNTGEIEQTLPPTASGYLITHVPEYITTHTGQKILVQ